MPAKPPRVIAVCGVDGVGKTSLIQMIRQDLDREDIAYLTARDHRDSAILERYCRRKRKTGSDRSACTYSRLLGIACAFDFVAAAEAPLRNALDQGKHVICDRHKLCHISFAHRVGSIFDEVSEMLAAFPDPDHIFYIKASTDTVMRRLATRTDEKPHLREDIELFSRSYDDMIRNADNVTTITNDGPLTEAYSRFRSGVLSIIGEY